MFKRVLVVDDDKVLQNSVRLALEYHNFYVDVADNGKEALALVYQENYDLVVMDVNMPELDGISTLIEIKNYDPSIIVLMLTAYSNVTDAVLAVKEGAYNYLEKPISSSNLVALIKRALKAKSLVETSFFSAPQLSLGDQEDQFVGKTDVMKKIFHIIGKLSKVNTPVLIRGESGTGKELVAKAIHYNGPRKDEKFVSINLAAIPEGVLESELFGHEKGAFTGAHERKIGKFQYADGGTLFLDEIGDIPMSIQVKLLRVLQDQSFSPVGSNRQVRTDVRIIAASHRPFEKLIKEGSFREDLFYRLNILPVYLPPLRERKDDIPLLVDYYIKYFNNLHHTSIQKLDESSIDILKSYKWPGNIRELRNVIEHAFIIETGDIIRHTSLPVSLRENSVDEEDLKNDSIIDFNLIKNSAINDLSPVNSDFTFSFEEDSNGRLDFQKLRSSFEKDFLLYALKKNNGKINRTALNANIPKKTLLRKIEKYEINPKDFY